MKSDDLWQVRIPSADRDEVLLAAAREAVEKDRPTTLKRSTWIKLILMHAVHPLGIHHWVAYRTFDPGSGRIILWPSRWVCAMCPRGIIRG